MEIDDVCREIMAEFAVLRAGQETQGYAINEIKEEIKAIKEQRYENGMQKATLVNTVSTLGTQVKEHIAKHTTQNGIRSQRNWGLWMAIITITLGGIAGWLFAYLKG